MVTQSARPFGGTVVPPCVFHSGDTENPLGIDVSGRFVSRNACLRVCGYAYTCIARGNFWVRFGL